ncbi:uncharacterized protein LOC131859313 [Cryptomeria japonica]|uniref:uncharacterized protein LOC131859313 n=1 Tax=Cryptomeria japonica TaxID=3369 RepID=UPI0027DA5FEC|nr:uncharacterized protein LOC131859313 [Cryptomeria japonica]
MPPKKEDMEKELQELQKRMRNGWKAMMVEDIKKLRGKEKGKGDESTDSGDEEAEGEEERQSIHEIPTNQKMFIDVVKAAQTEPKGSTLVWWNYTQGERVKMRKNMISSWSRMVSLIKAKFMPTDYETQIIKRFDNLKQKDLDVESYTEEFHKLIFKANHHEDEKEKVARYLNGLKFSIQDEMSMVIPRTVDECFQMALRAEEKLRRRGDQNYRGKGGRNNRGRRNFGGRNQFQKSNGETSY